MFEDSDMNDGSAEVQYSIYGTSAVDIELRDGTMHSLTSEHPNFDRIRSTLLEDAQAVSDEDYRMMINFGFAIGQKLETLSDRVKFDGNNVFFDGDAVHTSLGEHIVRMAKESNPRLGAMVKFLENLSQNPSEKSKASLYDWITNLREKGEKLTITKDGMLLAYKGVQIDAEGVSRSINAGPGIVDGVTMRGHLPNREGSVVEISRSYVDADTAVGCSTGLHAGTWNYAHGFARGRTLEVEINPRDVVSVPDDCQFQKLRVSRYVVIKETDAPETLPVYHEAEEWDEADLEEWLNEGNSLSDAEDFMADGYTYEQALEILEENEYDYDENEDDDDYDAQEWVAEGFTDSEIAFYKNLGLDVDEAIIARDVAATVDTSETSADEKEAERDARYSEWTEAGFSVEDADKWLGLGYTVDEALAEVNGEKAPEGDCEGEAEEELVLEDFVKAFSPEDKPKKKKGKKKNKKKNKQ